MAGKYALALFDIDVRNRIDIDVKLWCMGAESSSMLQGERR
jgi:hypothetical protein